MYENYHAITVRMAVQQAREEFWGAINDGLDLSYLVESEVDGEFIDAGYCLDQAPAYCVQSGADMYRFF